jgi:hypothetical protein
MIKPIMNKLISIFFSCILLVTVNGCKITRPFFMKKKKRKVEVTMLPKKVDTSDIVTVDKIILTDKNKIDTLTVKSHDSIYGRDIINKQLLDYKTFSCKARMKYDANGNKQNFTANFRLLKNKCIWASISGFGIEVARAIITPDSVKAINRLNKTSYLYSYNNIEKLINVELDFNTLQNLIIGNAIFTKGEITSVKEFGNICAINIKGANFTNQLSYNRTTKELQLIQVQTSRGISNTSFLSKLSNYKIESNRNLSTERTFFIQDVKGTVELTMDMVKQDFNDSLEFPFTIPKNFNKAK